MKTFCALLARDGHGARRNLAFTLVQNLSQPLLLTFVFGRILPASGMMQADYKNVLLPGTVCVSMIMSGVWGVAMPLISEFQFTREIEDRLLAPLTTGWLAVEKVVVGGIQAMVSGLVVIPAAWIAMGPDVEVAVHRPFQFGAVCLLVALLAGACGLVLGCSISQMQIGMVITLVVAPVITFGCAYYPWASLAAFPTLQYAVLLNPVVYASEGLRGTLAPQMPHIETWIVVSALAGADAALLAIGVRLFYRRAVG